MTNEIKHWEIINEKLVSVDTDLKSEGKKETQDLEPWIESNPEIVAPNILIIGKQVQTRSKDGRIDLLGIDRSGNLVIVELKRDQFPRDVLAQAIDYASDVSTWDVDKISEICMKYQGKSLEEYFSESFSDADLDNIDINDDQRIILVGFYTDPSLERMIKWISDKSDVYINAVILSYVKTSNGAEILSRTTTLSEEEAEDKGKRKKINYPMSDEPGTYDRDKLQELLTGYLAQNRPTSIQLRNTILPLCLEKSVVTREELKKAVGKDLGYDDRKAGYLLSTISLQIGKKEKDFLRQVLGFETPRYNWEKDNFSIREGYRDLVIKVLNNIKGLKETPLIIIEHPSQEIPS